MEITLQNIRSICRPQSIPLRPLTLLVGENSAGKTTFLAMVAHVNQSTFTSTRRSTWEPMIQSRRTRAADTAARPLFQWALETPIKMENEGSKLRIPATEGSRKLGTLWQRRILVR